MLADLGPSAGAAPGEPQSACLSRRAGSLRVGAVSGRLRGQWVFPTPREWSGARPVSSGEPEERLGC